MYFNQSDKTRKNTWGGGGINTQGKVKPSQKTGWNHTVGKINIFKGPKFMMKVKGAQSCRLSATP